MPTQILWSTQNLCSTPYLWHDALRTNNLHSKDWYGWLRSLILWWIKAAMSRHCSPGDVTVAKVGKRPCKYNWKQYNQPIGKSFWTNGWNICTSNVLASVISEKLWGSHCKKLFRHCRAIQGNESQISSLSKEPVLRHLLWQRRKHAMLFIRISFYFLNQIPRPFPLIDWE